MAQKPYLTKVPNLIYVHGFVIDAPMPMLDCNDFFLRDFSKFFMLELFSFGQIWAPMQSHSDDSWKKFFSGPVTSSAVTGT